MNQKFHIITRCTRQENLQAIYDSIFDKWYDCTWHIIFDCYRIKDLDAELLSKIKNKKVNFYFTYSTKNDYLYPQCHKAIDEISDGYVMFIDDDNIVHPEYFGEITKVLNDDYKVFVVDQFVGGKDFTGLETRIASKDNNKLKGVDIGQLTFHHSVLKKYRFREGYQADGMLVDEIMLEHPEWFYYLNKTLSYYNYIIPKEKTNHLPRILMIGNQKQELSTFDFGNYEENKLNVIWKPTDNDINKTLCEFDPDGILLVSDDYTKYDNLCKQSKQVRDKWITVNEVDGTTGQRIYDSAMINILKNDRSSLISYFTSVYNRGEKVSLQYDNLVKQTYDNWEWIVVNDSTDGGKTQKHLDKLMLMDPRVKVYEFKNKTKGVIGEAKYRAASLCNGIILAELDHDDFLVENCSELLMNAYKKYPNAGFFYTDSVEMKEDKTQVIYGEGFACGYGRYRTVKYQDQLMNVQVTPNINPKTIRHIVGVPNHIRAWTRDTYFSIGGHNRRLPIADDYELIVRTFLNTRMVKIPAMAYIQNMHSSNSQDVSRKDIQRRVRSIMYFYNEQIAKRFEELGVEDWAYKENPGSPLSVESRYGPEENYVNYIYEIN